MALKMRLYLTEQKIANVKMITEDYHKILLQENTQTYYSFKLEHGGVAISDYEAVFFVITKVCS